MASLWQPNGHAATGRTEGTILLRTGRLDELSVDAEKRTARVGAGVRSGDLVAAAAAHGLSGTPGSSPIVSVVGYTLGGGDYAIVLAMELALYAETELFGGLMMWPGTRAAEVLAAFREVTAVAPEELTVWAALVRFPGAPPMAAVALTYLGGETEARELLKPFDVIGDTISDSRKVLALAELASVTADPTDPSPSTGWTELLSDLDEATIEKLLAVPIDPLLVVQIRHVGGALARSGEGPHGAITEPYALYTVLEVAPGVPMHATEGFPLRVRHARRLRRRRGDGQAARRTRRLGRRCAAGRTRRRGRAGAGDIGARRAAGGAVG